MIKNEETWTPEEGVGFPIDSWIPESLGGKEPPLRGRVFVAQGVNALRTKTQHSVHAQGVYYD